jgi:hypothetical protein
MRKRLTPCLAGSEAASSLLLIGFFLAVSQALSKSIRADCKKASLPVLTAQRRLSSSGFLSAEREWPTTLGKKCEERDYLVSFFVVSSLDVHVVKHRERGERGETADRMPIIRAISHIDVEIVTSASKLAVQGIGLFCLVC